MHYNRKCMKDQKFVRTFPVMNGQQTRSSCKKELLSMLKRAEGKSSVIEGILSHKAFWALTFFILNMNG